ncbi:MAG: outer-membrane lipoprotein carrier protein LolA [Candidatus Symbiothrix sp.]|jgi:outer membrane lipoprotein-sorting protein|nr:outer-membrane lipoprotein carrier protein LolA [Candidatus Symbiothrix sp.]
MKKIFVLVVAFLLACSSGFAQKDARAKEYLDKSSEAFTKAGALSVHFTLNIKDVSKNVSESFEGDIELKGAKFHLNTPDMETWFDGKTQWALQKNYDELTITEPSAEELQVINPASLFMLYKKGCNYTYLGEKKSENGKPVHEIALMPQAKNSEMTKIILQIGSTDFMPVKIHISYKNKMENSIHIAKYQKQSNLPDSKFVFDKKKYPNAEIIDLR